MPKTEKKFEQWLHVKITDPELAEQLDAMSESDQRDRSKFVRWLIQQEWARRNYQAHWVGSPAEPLPIKITGDAKTSVKQEEVVTA